MTNAILLAHDNYFLSSGKRASRNFLHLVQVVTLPSKQQSLGENPCMRVPSHPKERVSELRADIVDYGHGFPVWPVRVTQVATTRAWLNTAEEFWWTKTREKVSSKLAVATFTLLNCVSRPIRYDDASSRGQRRRLRPVWKKRRGIFSQLPPIQLPCLLEIRGSFRIRGS